MFGSLLRVGKDLYLADFQEGAYREFGVLKDAEVEDLGVTFYVKAGEFIPALTRNAQERIRNKMKKRVVGFKED